MQAAQVDITVVYGGAASFGISQSSIAGAALISAANRALNTVRGPRGYSYASTNASVTAWTLPQFSTYE